MYGHYNNFDNPLVKNYFSSKTVAYPSSTGMDGVLVFSGDKEVFIPGDKIVKAVMHAYRVRVAFIRGDYCYALPQSVIDRIRKVEFADYLEWSLGRRTSPTVLDFI